MSFDINFSIYKLEHYHFCGDCGKKVDPFTPLISIFVADDSNYISKTICKDCALKLYQKIKPVLNTDLWILK
jgi:hypothetical protein